jgi:FlaA1/EpsC-like NDP-sugar epimerase
MILWRYAKAVFLGMLLLFMTMYIFKIEHISRLMLSIFFVLNLGLFFIEKSIVYVLLRKYRSRGFNSRNMLILGGKRLQISHHGAGCG